MENLISCLVRFIRNDFGIKFFFENIFVALLYSNTMCRYSLPVLFYKIATLENWAKFPWKQLCWYLFFNKIPFMIKKRPHWGATFPVNTRRRLDVL